ncbi:unnamed protein product, partial [Laminaria digitata]
GKGRGGGGGKRKGVRGPSACKNDVSSVKERTQSSRDTHPAVERGGGATNRGAAVDGIPDGEGVPGAAAAPGATRGQNSSRGVLPAPAWAPDWATEPKAPASKNVVDRKDVVDRQEKPSVGVIAWPDSASARTQEPRTPPGCRLLTRDPEDEPYFAAVRGTRRVRRSGNASSASIFSTTAAQQPPAAQQLPAARPLPAAQQAPAARTPAAADDARVQSSRAPPGLEHVVVSTGSDAAAAAGGNGAADSAVAAPPGLESVAAVVARGVAAVALRMGFGADAV